MKKPTESIALEVVLEVKRDEINIILDNTIKIINDHIEELQLGDFVVSVYRTSKKEKTENAEYTEIATIEYHTDPVHINVIFNNKKIKVREEDQRKEILLENAKIIIEKYKKYKLNKEYKHKHKYEDKYAYAYA